jgi:hypothetical protein
MEEKTPKPPLISVKRIGRIARILDELFAKVVAGFGWFVGKIGQKLRTTLHAGYWRNYAFFLFIALILLVILAIVVRK